MTRRILALLVLFSTLSGLTRSADAGPPQLPGVDIDEAWSDATFANPVLVAHAKDDAAHAFYEHFGFLASPTDPLHLFILTKDLRRAVGQRDEDGD